MSLLDPTLYTNNSGAYLWSMNTPTLGRVLILSPLLTVLLLFISPYSLFFPFLEAPFYIYFGLCVFLFVPLGLFIYNEKFPPVSHRKKISDYEGYAGFWKRLIAYLLDHFLGALVFPTLLSIIFYYKDGQTLGYKIVGIKIVHQKTGRVPAPSLLFGRFMAKIPVTFLTLGFGFLWIAFDRKKQGAHDMLADTVVVTVKKMQLKKTFLILGSILLLGILITFSIPLPKDLKNPMNEISSSQSLPPDFSGSGFSEIPFEEGEAPLAGGSVLTSDPRLTEKNADGANLIYFSKIMIVVKGWYDSEPNQILTQQVLEALLSDIDPYSPEAEGACVVVGGYKENPTTEKIDHYVFTSVFGSPLIHESLPEASDFPFWDTVDKPLNCTPESLTYFTQKIHQFWPHMQYLYFVDHKLELVFPQTEAVQK